MHSYIYFTFKNTNIALNMNTNETCEIYKHNDSDTELCMYST